MDQSPPPSLVRKWAEQDTVRFGPLTLYLETRWVEANGKERRLSYALFCILAQLMAHQGQPVSLQSVRDYMIARGKCLPMGPFAYRAHIYRLREELLWLTDQVDICNIFDRGYVIAVKQGALATAV